jgi:acetyl esterase/lipase
MIAACTRQQNEQSSYSIKRIDLSDTSRYAEQVFDSVKVEKDILFARVVNHKDALVELRLDVYEPFGDSCKNRPVILWVHGGGFTGGTRTQSYISILANAFTRRGYVSVSTDYRLRSNPGEDIKGTIDDAVEDVIQALVWIRKNSEKYGINKDHIIIGGGSAGGILSTNLCFSGPADPPTRDKSGLIAFVNLWGSPHKNRMYATIDESDPPTILIHGKADSVVPFSNCRWLAGRLDSAGVKNEVFAIEKAGHTPVAHIEKIESEIAAFLYEILSSI